MKTVKLNKVLIALDFDRTAQKVAEVGFSMAKSMGAEIILLHVVSDPLQYNSNKHITVMGFAGYKHTIPLILDGIEELKSESQHFLEKSKQHLGDPAIKLVVKDGDTAESILKTAKAEHADIIILGSHSHKWIENIIMGSVTEKVLRNTTIPLFIVPTRKRL